MNNALSCRALYYVLSAAADCIRSRNLRVDVQGLVDSGRVNADDTVYAEKAAPEAEWQALFIGSIRGLLSDGTHSRHCVAWFARHGIVA